LPFQPAQAANIAAKSGAAAPGERIFAAGRISAVFLPGFMLSSAAAAGQI